MPNVFVHAGHEIKEVNEVAQFGNGHALALFLFNERVQFLVNEISMVLVTPSETSKQHTPELLLVHKPLLVPNFLIHRLPHLVQNPVVNPQFNHFLHNR
jgi:hypothetical protein